MHSKPPKAELDYRLNWEDGLPLSVKYKVQEMRAEHMQEMQALIDEI